MSSPREERPRPAMRRDADGVVTIGPTWESLVERLIREAQERGEFDDLPGQGEPIALDDPVHAGEHALAYHVLRNAGAAPPWIEADKAVREQLARHDALIAEARRVVADDHLTPLTRRRLEQRLEEGLAAHDAAVQRLNAEAPSASLHRRPIDRDAAGAQLRAVLDGSR